MLESTLRPKRSFATAAPPAEIGRKGNGCFGAGDGKKQTFRITASFRRAERRLSSARASGFRRANPWRSRKADDREEVELDEAAA